MAMCTDQGFSGFNLRPPLKSQSSLQGGCLAGSGSEGRCQLLVGVTLDSFSDCSLLFL